MRIEISSICNYRCKFCCWQNNDASAHLPRFSPGQLEAFCKGLIRSGCFNINLTGGEPLLLPREYLCETIAAISGIDGLGKLWVTTNGSMLCDYGFCLDLKRAGLNEAAVSIASETDDGYMRYTDADVSLSKLMQGVGNAASCGIDVRIHVPLSPEGICSFEQLEDLIDRVSAENVREVFYFRLHNSGIIKHRFDELYVDPMIVTNGFSNSKRWHYRETESGRPYYTDGTVRVNVPRRSVRLITQNCKMRDCKSFCQGIYSAYCIPGIEGWYLRACNRVFDDRNNEFPLDDFHLEDGGEAELDALLNTVWRYAYEA